MNLRRSVSSVATSSVAISPVVIVLAILLLVGAAIGARQQLDDGLVLLTVDRFGEEVRTTAVEIESGALAPS